MHITVYVWSSVCEMATLTHDDTARGETSLVFYWSLTAESVPGDCDSLTICVTPADVACEPVASMISGSVNITGLIPGTSYAANITAADGVDSPTSKQASGNTS